MKFCAPYPARQVQGGNPHRSGHLMVYMLLPVCVVALGCLHACGGRQELVQLVAHEVRPDTVPCSVGPSWELPPGVIGERPAADEGLRLLWCAQPEGSGGLQLPAMAPQRRAVDDGIPRTAP